MPPFHNGNVIAEDIWRDARGLDAGGHQDVLALDLDRDPGQLERGGFWQRLGGQDVESPAMA